MVNGEVAGWGEEWPTDAPRDPGGVSSERALWPGDHGTLPFVVRRLLVRLMTGPYVSQEHDPQLWSALLDHESVVREHLANMLLDLAVDHESEVAFCRNLTADDSFTEPVPKVLRTVNLTFVDSALLLHLRELLVRGRATGERVFVGRQELLAHMDAYAASAGGDEALFVKRVDSSIKRMVDWSILSATTTDERWEISAIVALIVTPDVVAQIQDEYERIARDADGDE